MSPKSAIKRENSVLVCQTVGHSFGIRISKIYDILCYFSFLYISNVFFSKNIYIYNSLERNVDHLWLDSNQDLLRYHIMLYKFLLNKSELKISLYIFNALEYIWNDWFIYDLLPEKERNH